MAIKNKNGFALLIAVIFMSVMLAIGISLGSLGYKQQVLASGAIASQHAFYAADTGLEYTLYEDQRQDLFNAVSGRSSFASSTMSMSGQLYVVWNGQIDIDNGASCADITVYKPKNVGTTYLFSQGYDVSCSTVANPAGARFVSRGISIHY